MPAIPIALLAVAATTPALCVPCHVLGRISVRLIRRVVVASGLLFCRPHHRIVTWIGRVRVAADCRRWHTKFAAGEPECIRRNKVVTRKKAATRRVCEHEYSAGIVQIRMIDDSGVDDGDDHGVRPGRAVPRG